MRKRYTQHSPYSACSIFLTAFLILLSIQLGQASVVYATHLEGVKSGKGNSLTWSTSSESNCDFFLLEKSVDGILFERVAILKAGGNSKVVRKYEYMDSKEHSLRVFYRVLQVDNDGTSEYTHAVILSDKAEDAPFRLEYVENSTTQRDLRFSIKAKNAGKMSYRIMTQLGKIQLKGDQNLTAGTNLMSIDLTSLEVGTYQLAIKVKNDIEVIAIRKTDHNDIPTVNLTVKDR